MRAPNALEADEVAAYLREHSDFFLGRDALLLDMQLRHPSGPAVSLIERQVADLRRRNQDLHRRLSDLLTRARDNDQLIEKTRRLTLALLETHDLGDLVDALYYSLDREFGIEQARLLLIHNRPLSCNTPVVRLADAQRVLAQRMRLTPVQAGLFTPHEVQFLFADQAHQVGSAALMVLRPRRPLGFIAFGHRDAAHYKANVDVIFLGYLGQLLELLLPERLNRG